jgi:hypothetical protein
MRARGCSGMRKLQSGNCTHAVIYLTAVCFAASAIPRVRPGACFAFDDDSSRIDFNRQGNRFSVPCHLDDKSHHLLSPNSP